MSKILEAGERKVKVTDIRLGDRVDLYGDRYADPDSDPMNCYEFAYEVVCGIERETPECIRLDFEEAGSCGFPLDHELVVAGNVAEILDAKIVTRKSLSKPYAVVFSDGSKKKFETREEAELCLSNHRSDNNLDAITGEYLGA